jgi:hypothetical protein
MAFYKTVDGTSHAIDATGTSTAALLIPGKGRVLHIVGGDEVVAIRVGDASVGAAVLPTAGSPTDCYVLQVGEVLLIQVPVDCYLRCICTATATIYVTRGEEVYA